MWWESGFRAVGLVRRRALARHARPLAGRCRPDRSQDPAAHRQGLASAVLAGWRSVLSAEAHAVSSPNIAVTRYSCAAGSSGEAVRADLVQHRQDRRLVAAVIKGAPEPLEGGHAREPARVVELGEGHEADLVVELVGRLAQPVRLAAQARRLAEQGILRADVTVGAATDLLCLLTSFDSFDLLFTGRALPVGKAAELLTTTAERTLCQ